MNAALVRFTLAVAGIAGVFFYLAAGGGPAPATATRPQRSPEITATSYFSPLLGTGEAPAAAALPSPAATSRTATEDPQTGHDLYGLFQRLGQSDDALELKQAAGILARCEALLAGWDDLRQRTAQATDGYAARNLAGQALGQRCQGFRQASGKELDGRRQALHVRMASRGLDPQAGAQAGSTLLPGPMVRGLLGRNDPAAFEEARPALLRSLAGRLGIGEETPAWDDLQAALLLAGCARGAACGPDSFDALRRCAYQERCGGGRFDGWQDGLPAERSARVAGMRDRFLAALQARDYRALGLE